MSTRRVNTPGSKKPSPKQEQARREREALRARMARRKRNQRLAKILVPVVVFAGALLFVLFHRTGSPTAGPAYATVGQSIDPSTLPGIQTGPAPWAPEEAQLRARLGAIGLAALPAEAFVVHIHQHVDIHVDGRKVTVPALIGISQREQFLSPIHTHDATGVIHVESPTVRPYTLGEFFDVWGVRLTQQCLGGYCNGGGKTLRVYANGHPVTGNVRQLQLTAHEEIVVTFGTEAELPNPVPSSYAFPFGL